MLNYTSLNSLQKTTFIFLNIQLLISVVGISSNLLTIWVFSRKRFSTSSYSFYFRVMVVFEIIILAHTFRHWSRFFLNFDLDKLSPFLCKTNDLQSSAAGMASTWFLTVILLDRFVTIVYHNQVSVLKRKWFQLLVVFVVVIYSILVNSFMPAYFTFEKFNNSLNMVNRCTKPRHVLNLHIRVFFANVIPNTIINFFLYSKLIMFIYSSRKKITMKTNSRLVKDLKLAISSIVITLFNFLCKMPFGIGLALTAHFNMRADLAQIVFIVGVTILALNHAATFFVNIVCNSMFLEEVLVILRCKNKQSSPVFV